jgi:hypothetical protein
VNPASEGVEPKAFRVGSELRSLNAAPSVDFDNDGLPDLVFWEQSEDHYYGGTIFYLLPGNADPAEAAVTSAALPLEALRMFPCQFDPSVASVRDCPPLSQKADEAAVKVAVAGKSVSFRVRYTSMTALQFDHKTYLLLTSASQDTAHAAALIEPQGKLKFAPRCLFMGPHS